MYCNVLKKKNLCIIYLFIVDGLLMQMNAYLE